MWVCLLGQVNLYSGWGRCVMGSCFVGSGGWVLGVHTVDCYDNDELAG